MNRPRVPRLGRAAAFAAGALLLVLSFSSSAARRRAGDLPPARLVADLRQRRRRPQGRRWNRARAARPLPLPHHHAGERRHRFVTTEASGNCVDLSHYIVTGRDYSVDLQTAADAPELATRPYREAAWLLSRTDDLIAVGPRRRPRGRRAAGGDLAAHRPGPRPGRALERRRPERPRLRAARARRGQERPVCPRRLGGRRRHLPRHRRGRDGDGHPGRGRRPGGRDRAGRGAHRPGEPPAGDHRPERRRLGEPALRRGRRRHGSGDHRRADADPRRQGAGGHDARRTSSSCAPARSAPRRPTNFIDCDLYLFAPGSPGATIPLAPAAPEAPAAPAAPAGPPLVISLDSPSLAAPGGVAVYRLTVTNNGTAHRARPEGGPARRCRRLAGQRPRPEGQPGEGRPQRGPLDAVVPEGRSLGHPGAAGAGRPPHGRRGHPLHGRPARRPEHARPPPRSCGGWARPSRVSEPDVDVRAGSSMSPPVRPGNRPLH